jgi:hypothetical protein
MYYSAESGKELPGFSHGEELPRALAHVLLSHIFDIDKISELSYPIAMKQIITAKLKLHPDPAQFQSLRATQLKYRDALPLRESLLV